MAVARLLHIYEKHYTFRRMNNQVVAIIFSAALMLLYVTISPGRNGVEGTNNAEMVAYLNLCFRALDELGQSFENAKRTRDFLVSLQRRWQAHMRRTGSARKRQPGSRQPSQVRVGQSNRTDPDASRKRSRLSIPNNSSTMVIPPAIVTTTPPSAPLTQQQQQKAPDESQFTSGDIDWMRSPDLHLLPGDLADHAGQVPSLDPAATAAAAAPYVEAEPDLPSLADIEPWWDSPNGTTTFGGSL